MNLRTTAWLFALMLSMLWLFGLMLAFKKNPLDKAAVVPTLQAARNVEIDKVVVERKPEGKEPQEFVFVKDKDGWRFSDPASKLAVKVESFRVDQIVSQIKNARRDDEADVSNNPSRYGLDNPKATIVLHGHTKAKSDDKDDDADKDEEKDQPAGKESPGKERTWRFFIGTDSPDKRYVFVNSSDEPQRVFAVLKSSVDALFFEDPNHLRSKRLFEFTDFTAKTVELKRGAQEVELKKGDDSQWRFVKPGMGLADYEGPTPTKEAPAKTPEGGVKGLLNAIIGLRVDADSDFVPLAKDNIAKYKLDEETAPIRIQVGSPNDKKEITKETMLIGAQERGYYYARMAGDQGVFKLPEKQLEPIVSALKDPGQLRSIDVALIDAKKVDAVVLKSGGEETKLWHPEGKDWKIQIGGAEAKKAAEPAITKLLDTLQGKRQIKRFHDDADAKKIDAELGLDSPVLEVTLYTEALDKPADKKDDKAEAKKDEKKAAKQEEKKDAAKADGFNLKKDVKPAVTLKFGKADKDTVPVLRMTPDGLTARFAVPKSVLDAALPPEGALAFLDAALPSFEPSEVVRLELDRAGKKVELEKGTGPQADRWIVKTAQDVAGQNLADPGRVEVLYKTLGHLAAKKWIKRLDAKANLDEYGLEKPDLVATVQLKKQRITPAAAMSALGMLSGPVELRGLVTAAAFAANQQSDKGEAVVIKFGKESADKDVFARHSGNDLLFVVSPDLVRMVRELDLRDRTMLLAMENAVAAGVVGAPAALPVSGLMALSPHATATITDIDPAKVKEIRLAVRTPYELRQFAFGRKDKEWVDQSSLMDFTPDAAKVQQFVENMSRFRADRWIALGGGPKTDQKLDAKSFTAKIELITEDGRTATLTVGTRLDRFGYFGHASTWPESVFLVQFERVEPLLRGIAWFAKERVAAAE
jgi:hypothetical protein